MQKKCNEIYKKILIFHTMKSNIEIHRTKKEYTKPPLTIESQIELLKNRWLIFSDEEYAKGFLNRVSYYRLSAYMRFFLSDDKETFRDKIKFKDITNLYNFDSDLKILLLEALETIEIDFKTQITNILSTKYWTGFRFMDEDNFNSKEEFINIIKHIESEIEKNKENSMPIKHYYDNYTSPKYPPCRMLMQIMSFWNVCSLYKALSKLDKIVIAKRYWLRFQQIESRMVCLSYLRNICAHSDRVWNRQMKKNMTTKWIRQYSDKWNKLFTYLVVICYLFWNINPTAFSERMKKLIKGITKSNTINSKVKYMWFPDNRQNILSWKIKIEYENKH